MNKICILIVILFFSNLFYFFIGFIVGWFALLFYTTNKVKSIIGDDYKDYVSASGRPFMFNFLSAISYLKERKKNYKNEKNKLNNKLKDTRDEYKTTIDDLNKKFEDRNKDLNYTESKVSEEKPVNFKEDPTSEPVILSHKNDSKSKNLYFTIPEQDGSFVISNGSESNDGRKYFKISFDESSSKASITYISSQRDGRAINRLDTNLKPVCDIMNISNASSANKIEILKKGEVLLQGDKWVIDSNNKIKIRLV